MAHRTRKLLETLTGNGQVLLDDKAVATVSYSIAIHQEILHEQNETFEGLKHISGNLLVISGEQDLVTGGEMILVLKDGRRARFIAFEGSAPPGSARIHVNEII